MERISCTESELARMVQAEAQDSHLPTIAETTDGAWFATAFGAMNSVVGRQSALDAAVARLSLRYAWAAPRNAPEILKLPPRSIFVVGTTVRTEWTIGKGIDSRDYPRLEEALRDLLPALNRQYRLEGPPVYAARV